MEPFHLTYLQIDLHWEDFPANQQRLDHYISALNQPSDLILLPEMFGSGFTMEPQHVAQEMNGPAVQWMGETAQKSGASIMGSLVIQEEGQYFNRLLCADPDGSIQYYDKRHLFSYAGEEKTYTPGNHHLILTIKGWRILPLICYDLRFPVWSRNVSGYDILVYVANWPTPRIDAWTALLKARAIENQCYVAGVNRVGEDPLGNQYSGQSAVFDMGGHVVIGSGDKEETRTAVLDHQVLTDYRKRYTFLPDRDHFTLR